MFTFRYGSPQYKIETLFIWQIIEAHEENKVNLIKQM